MELTIIRRFLYLVSSGLWKPVQIDTVPEAILNTFFMTARAAFSKISRNYKVFL
jgi:hypothetical protein